MENLMLSNINLSTLVKRLGRRLDFAAGDGYNTWLPCLLEADTGFPDELKRVFLILDGAELRRFFPGKEDVEKAYGIIMDCADRFLGIKFYVNTIDMYQVQEIDEQERESWDAYEQQVNGIISGICEKRDNIRKIDLKAMIHRFGADRFYSPKMWYMASARFSAEGEKALEEAVAGLIEAEKRPGKKCMVLDLDNTLWGGVIGEDGAEGIELSSCKEGARYRDFQRQLLRMKEKGVLLAVCSKNNERDALEGLRHPDMLLKPEDFVSMKINWAPKPQNLKEMAEELNLGLDSFVFIDDHPAERAQMRESLTMVEVPEFPSDTSMLEQFGNEIYKRWFYTDTASREDGRKTQMYRNNALRNRLQKRTGDLDEFIKSLSIRLTIRRAGREHVGRIVQLVNKTNQFNLTTKRYDEKTVAGMLGDASAEMFLGEVKDRFGDDGICLVCIVKYSGDMARIDTFLMSCRVMGRQIEYYFLEGIAESVRDRGCARLSGEYIPTEKNRPCQEFYEKAGFWKTPEGTYEMDLEGYRKKTGDLMEVSGG